MQLKKIEFCGVFFATKAKKEPKTALCKGKNNFSIKIGSFYLQL